MKFRYQAVDRIPKQLDNNIVYHSEEFEIGALLCACGCGHRVMLLVPDSHRITSHGGMATVRPSIAVCDVPCKSHYYITEGQVKWLPAFTDAMASAVMSGQIARHKSLETKNLTWGARVRAGIVTMYGKMCESLRRIYRFFSS